MSNWRQLAACADENPELFFPTATGGKWSHAYQEQVDTAKSVCHRCPVSDLCFMFAMENHAEGVWGETTDDERKDIRKSLKAEGVAA